MKVLEKHFPSLDSTNSYAKLHRQEFDPHALTCISADEQTAGYGRYGRTWHSPRGQNIYASFVFRLPPNTPHLTSLAQIMTLSYAKVLLKEGLHPKVKWPNDVQLSGKKAAGILCETSFDRDHVTLFLGIGINVNMDSHELARIDQPATSLKTETNRTWDQSALLKKLQHQFAADLETFKQAGFQPFCDPFNALLAYKGESVRCFDGKKEWIGICHSVANDGQLILHLPNNQVHTVLSGDLSH